MDALHAPLQEIQSPFGAPVRLFVKRDDLLHPTIQGNKWRKLAPVLQHLGPEKPVLLTFGGAFSNHLHAVAHAGRAYGFATIGIVRGSAADFENPTLADCRQCGMQIFPVQKTDYERLKKAESPSVFKEYGLEFPENILILPEGGDTTDALVGCKAIAVEILEQLPDNAGKPLYFCVPAGTGCTAAGVIAGAGARARTLVFPAAPYGVDEPSILKKLEAANETQPFDFQVVDGMAPRKFAQMTDALFAFVQSFKQTTDILLDPIYTAKMMFRLHQLIDQQFFPPGSCIVALHTGGLQGWAGMKHFQKILP